VAENGTLNPYAPKIVCNPYAYLWSNKLGPVLGKVLALVKAKESGISFVADGKAILEAVRYCSSNDYLEIYNRLGQNEKLLINSVGNQDQLRYMNEKMLIRSLDSHFRRRDTSPD
jgi:hypothetical protein